MVQEENEIINTVIKEEIVEVVSLKDHPRNYYEHPDDQLDHIEESIRANGIYKNVVIAQDSTLLAGHGVIRTLRRMGVEYVPVRRLPLNPDDPRALKVLAGDNMISHLAVINDRVLTDVLKEVHESDITNLMGTGFDEMMLTNLAFVTRSEFQNFNEAAHWVGLPEYEDSGSNPRITIHFLNEDNRAEFIRITGIKTTKAGKNHGWTAWWPPREKKDLSSVEFNTNG